MVLTVHRTEESWSIGAVAQSQINSRSGKKLSGRFTGQCFRCGGLHMLKDCKEWPKPPVTCYRCGEKGHIVSKVQCVVTFQLQDSGLIRLKVQHKDFCIEFDGKKWTVEWCWINRQPIMKNDISIYERSMQYEEREAFEKKVDRLRKGSWYLLRKKSIVEYYHWWR